MKTKLLIWIMGLFYLLFSVFITTASLQIGNDEEDFIINLGTESDSTNETYDLNVTTDSGSGVITDDEVFEIIGGGRHINFNGWEHIGNRIYRGRGFW